ncbi:MAG: helix-turn-helix transcriptional regulator [Dermatophilaceae bacterium]|nr:helix-turn-helix transcriptional regulator [Dermatophilaceae bacterium]
MGQGGERCELGFQPHVEPANTAVRDVLTRQPAQLKLETLAALCTALDCTPNDLLELDTTAPKTAPTPQASTNPGSDTAAAASGQGHARGGHRPPPF